MTKDGRKLVLRSAATRPGAFEILPPEQTATVVPPRTLAPAVEQEDAQLPSALAEPEPVAPANEQLPAANSITSFDLSEDLLALTTAPAVSSVMPSSLSLLAAERVHVAAQVQTPSSSRWAVAYHRTSSAQSLAPHDDAVDLLALTELSVPLRGLLS